MTTLRSDLIRLAAASPRVRPSILALLTETTDKEASKMLPRVTGKTAGFSYAEEPLYLLFVEKTGKPFNIDTLSAIRNVWLPVKSNDGEADVAPNVRDVKYGPINTRAGEMQGLHKEVVVTLSVPKGEGDKFFLAIQRTVGRNFLSVEKLGMPRKPGTVKKASVSSESLQFANTLVDIITSVDDDELWQIPGLLTKLRDSTLAMQREIGNDMDAARNLTFVLPEALRRQLKPLI